MPSIEQSAGRDGGTGRGEYEKSLLRVGKIDTVSSAASCSQGVSDVEADWLGGRIRKTHEQSSCTLADQGQWELSLIQGRDPTRKLDTA